MDLFHTINGRLPRILAGLLLAGCGGGIIDGTDGTAQLELYLTDAPADEAEAVYVNVNTTEVLYLSADDPTGDGEWLSISSVPVTYDLLLLQGGATASLGSIELDPGTVTRIRLVIDAADPGSIVIDGQDHPLTLPTGGEDGFTLEGDIPLLADQLTTAVIDFDAAQSVQEVSDGEYLLQPVLTLQRVETGDDGA